jgi:hypothetical protein
MNYQEVRTALESIVPEIRDSKDPEGTLLKFAGDNNLYPSQLRKLGESVNILKTLNFFEKSANRGDSFDLVDVSSVVDKYMTPAKAKAQPEIQKAASSSELDLNDISSWTEKAADETYGVPDFYAEAAGHTTYPSVKLANQIDSLHKEANAFWDERETRYNKEQVINQVESDYEHKAKDIFQKLADHIRTIPDVKFSVLEEDAIRLFGGQIKQACDLASRYLSQCSVVHERVDEVVLGQKKLAHDRTGLAGEIKKAQEVIDMLAAAKEFKKQAFTSFPPTSSPTPKTEAELKSQFKKKKGESKKDYQNRIDDKLKKEQERSKNWNFRTSEPPSMGMLGEGKGEGKKKKESIVDSVMGNIEAAGAGSLAGTYKGLSHAGKDIARAGKKYKSKQKETLDKALDSVESEASLQRLMLTDPIISEADPKMVKELYETIAAHAPDMAKDIGMLRFALREAIQYEGVPPQTLKDLIDMQKSKSTIRKYDAETKEKAEKQD